MRVFSLFSDFSAPTNVPPRVGRTLDFKIVDRADKTNAEEVLEAELGRLVYLQICFQPGTPFNCKQHCYCDDIYRVACTVAHFVNL